MQRQIVLQQRGDKDGQVLLQLSHPAQGVISLFPVQLPLRSP